MTTLRGRRSALHDLGLLTVGQILSQLLNVWALVVIARTLGSHWFGVVQVGVAFSAYALIVAEWGMFSLGIREMSRIDDPDRALAYGRSHTGMLVLQAAVVLLAGLVLLPRLPFYHQDPAVFLLYLSAVVPQVFMQSWIAIGMERMFWVGMAKIGRSFLYAGMVLLLLSPLARTTGWPAHRWVPLMFVVSFALANLLTMVPLARWLGRPVLPRLPDWPEMRRRWREAAPIGASVVTLRVLLNIDLVMLGLLAAPETAGNYAAASRLMFLLVVAVEVLWMALLPRLSRLARQERDEFRRSFNHYLGFVVAGLLPIAVGGVLVGPDLVALLYGDEFPGAGPVFQVLAVSYSLLSVGYFLGNSLVAEDRQRAYFPPLVACALVAIAGTYLLIPRYGGIGACWGMFASHMLLAITLGLLYRRTFSRRLCGLLLALVPALGALVGAVLLAGSWPVVVRIVLGGAAYLTVGALPLLQFARRRG
ncbi:MAG: flippase [Candidatus Krumholzibacteriia bacterium]